MEKKIKVLISEVDKKMRADLEKRYPGWTYVRYQDNSLAFVPPKRV